MTTQQILLLLMPVIIIQFLLLALALRDLLRPERRVRGGSKPLWALVILFVSLFGPIVYFLAGRDEE